MLSTLGFVLASLGAAQDPHPGHDANQPSARLWVLLEDDQGQAVTARIYLRDSTGRAYTPSGSLARQTRRTDEFYFHASGRFQIEMPPGSAIIEAIKGFEYVPVKRSVELVADRTTVVTLTLRRFIDLPSMGWYSGDVHMHPNHVQGGPYMTMADCLLVAAGEDIQVANLLISNTDSAHVFDTEFFRSGQVEPLSTRESMMVVQEEFRNTSGMYGHNGLLGISRLVEPFFSGLPDSDHWEDYPPNYAIAKQTQDQGGAVSFLHPADGPEIPVGLHIAREFPIDLALGVVDALDILSNLDEEGGCWMYYRVLNCGLKCTASAGTDSRMDVMQHSMPGGGKVYVKTGSPLTYEQWVAGYKAGRTFVSNGPLLFLEVDGKEPGAEIHLSEPQTFEVRARAESLVPMQVLEILVNGQVVAHTAPGGDGTAVSLVHALRLDKSSWVAARVWGPEHRWVVNDSKTFAHTSPVYCYMDNQPIASPEDAKIVVAWIERLLQDVKASPRFATEAKRQEVIDLFEKGKAYYQRMAMQN